MTVPPRPKTTPAPQAPTTPTLAERLRRASVPSPASRPKAPLWKGPQEDGITYSLLSRFLVCRERFRLLVVEGLKVQDHFNHRLEYGSMWHVCEEAMAAGQDHTNTTDQWEPLTEYARLLMKKYPTDKEQIDHWYNVCRLQFPLYVDYWQKHPDVKDRTPLLQEVAFAVPYTLPSGRVVLLRGKWDSVDLIGKGKHARIFLQENKTKGDINELLMKRQLTFDLQTLIYLTALHEWQRTGNLQTVNDVLGTNRTAIPIVGVRYNVVRRPLSGGKGTIRQHQPTKSNPLGESKQEFYDRLAGIIKESPQDFFMRWEVGILPADVERFRHTCLDPLLEQLCDWWKWITSPSGIRDPFGFDQEENCDLIQKEAARIKMEGGDVISFLCRQRDLAGVHWRHPFGVYNVLDEGGSTDVDDYLATGSEAGLYRTDNLFPELG